MFDRTRKTVTGGYSPVEAIVLIHAVGLYSKKLITFRDFRAVFALLYMVSIRFAASCSGGSTQARYTVQELAKLLGAQRDSHARRAVTALKKSGILLEFSESKITFNLASLPSVEDTLGTVNRTAKGTYRNPLRKIPVPRNALILIAQTNRYANAMALVLSFVRCLSIDREGNIKAKGSVKNSWIATVCDIGLSTAERIRQEWIAWGWLKRDTGSSRRKQNRTGAYCEFNLDQIGGTISPSSSTSMRVPISQKATSMRVPYKDNNLPTESKNQKPPPPGGSKEPTLDNIVPADLHDLDRLETLFSQAVERKYVHNTPIYKINFRAAAIRALEIQAKAKGNAVKIFAGIIRKGLYHVISNAQADAAEAQIKKRWEYVDQFAAKTASERSVRRVVAKPLGDTSDTRVETQTYVSGHPGKPRYRILTPEEAQTYYEQQRGREKPTCNLVEAFQTALSNKRKQSSVEHFRGTTVNFGSSPVGHLTA